MSTLRPISSALLAELGLTARRPGYLIQIDWPSGTTRSATFATITALGHVWTKHDVKVTNWSEDGTGKGASGLVFDNSDLMWGALAFGSNLQQIPVHIHLVYAGATADADIVPDWFSGMVDGASMPAGSRAIELGICGVGENVLYIPREILGAAVGINHLASPGKTIHLGGPYYYTFVAAR